jgi:hypothetical protein
VAKARSYGLWGVFVVPFVSSDPVWQTLMAASRTSGGAHRLAVMAVDSSRWSLRSFAGVATPCGRHRELRALIRYTAYVTRRIGAASLKRSCGSADQQRPQAAARWSGLVEVDAQRSPAPRSCARESDTQSPLTHQSAKLA